MRVTAGIVTGVLLVWAMTWGARPDEGPSDKQASNVPARHWVKLTFGLDDKAVSWDGSVSVRNGRILQTVPWSFEQRDRFDPVAHKWFCTTVVLKGRSASSFAEPQRGVLIELEHSGQAQLDVQTKQGPFVVPVADLRAGRPLYALDKRACAERLGTSTPLPEAPADTDAETEEDFPSLAIDADGHRWVAWQGYDDAAKRDHLCVLDLDRPEAKVEEIVTAREQTGPQLVATTEGLWLFWSAPSEDNWDVWAAKRGDSGWDVPQRLTTAEGTDFFLATATGPAGEIWLAWQAFRNGSSDILVKRLKQRRWSDEIPVAFSEANEWEPSISVDATGRAWIGYDSYANGNYDVFLTSVVIGTGKTAEQGPTIGIAISADFEAHASVDATGGNGVWVAYDAAGPNWGKDYTRDATTFKNQYAEPLHANRRLGLRAVVDGKVKEPASPLPQKINKLRPEKVNHSDVDEYKRFHELPHLQRDGSGRLWVLFRQNRQGYAGHPPMGANWECYATTFADGSWLEPALLPQSVGRQNQQVSTALDETGRIHAAWSAGDHLIDLSQRVYIGTLPELAGNGEEPPLVPAKIERARPSPEPVVRGWPIHNKGETYQVYFGDLHRHTTISLCTPTIDGCLVDAYRYALDAARLDFLAVTDHTRDTDPFPWWRTQKANDLFYAKGTLVPIYAYERSNGVVGGGHRNVFFLERDWPVFRSDAHYSWTKESPPEDNTPDAALYPHLRGKDAFTAAHTPGYSRKAQKGTWTYHDPQVEPLAEIIQTYRRDYERPGAPQWPDARTRGNVAEEASLWYALARGNRLGFIASSDHHATHTSFACVWAKGLTREDVFEGLRSRRTYAATDKIILDVRMGDALMGQETVAGPDVPALTIHVRGTAKVEEIQVVRNRTVVASFAPGEVEVTTTFRDDQYPGGAAYYYVRVRQADNNMAWGSPIWVK